MKKVTVILSILAVFAVFAVANFTGKAQAEAQTTPCHVTAFAQLALPDTVIAWEQEGDETLIIVEDENHNRFIVVTRPGNALLFTEGVWEIPCTGRGTA